MDQYPYQTAFHRELKAIGRAQMTIDAYDATLCQLFNYLEDQRPIYAHDPSANNVTETDVRAYLNWLRDEQDITLATFNKVLSQLSRYFRFLFTHQLIDNYPTLTIHGKATKPNQHLSTKWLLKLDDILADDQLQLYTRAVLFLSSRGYTVAEFLQPGFGDVWRSLQPKNAVERDFMKTFAAYIAPIQQLQNCQDIFLKQRLNREHPWISNAGLFKYLKADEDYLGFKLAPKYLHQSYILYEIARHRDATPQELQTRLRLNPQSLLYYQRLLLQLK